jgi:putative acetyltransferase
VSSTSFIIDKNKLLIIGEYFMKLISDLGRMAIGTRCSLVADKLYDEVRNIYHAEGLDFDPRNFLLFRSFIEHGETSVGALALEMRCTQARASQKLAELEKTRLVERVKNQDARKSCFRLSEKSKKMIAQLTPIWSILDDVLRDEFPSDQLLTELKRFETQMAPGRLASLVLARLSSATLQRGSKAANNFTFKVLLPPFTRDVVSRFEELNRAWLIEYGFNTETPDRELFSDLSAYVSKHDGVLLVAEIAERVIATALLLKHDEKKFELAKFCVDKNARSSGIGRRLLGICEIEARARNATSLILETSSTLKSALKLYKEAGFKSHPVTDSPYDRVDLVMTKSLV